MPVETPHPAYIAHEKKAQRVRDAVAGTDAIKGARTAYLPHPVSGYERLAGELKQEADERYAAYLQRASWLGVTGRTHEGMLGGVFRKPPAADLPASIDYMLEDADGSGMALEQFAKLCVSALEQSGRAGVLVDYPEAEDGLTREQTRGMKATLRFYDSQSIINWRREGEALTLVVLQEAYEDEIDEFERNWEKQYRVLRLEDGVYTQEVYRDSKPAGDKVTPRDAAGNAWREIPFQFLGAKNNDEIPDKPLLLDIADLNIAHYRNSADLEEAAFLCGQPMLHVDIGDMDSNQWQELNPNGVQVGSRRGIQTKGGSIAMVQAEERNLPLSLMEQKERQMLAIGARLIEQRGQNETAEAVRARSGAENASLSSVATNVSNGLEKALRWALGFMGGTGNVSYQLNQQFYAEDADPQEVIARIQELDRGLIAKKDYRDWRRRTGGIDPKRTDEEIDDEAQAGGTTIGAL
ncbi:DUF4055 domain-containing protein [uncultured Halomonas sp.]|uniref:DUF4055 domain-containing protein n=1 Tax=uncultured Halomonas sp. TaxID=173971 RepID=UPI00261E7690|nr:DUF4055 domain-containing protein [uncultured Halomonas sp.]